MASARRSPRPARLLYLPPYSPDLNPIEQLFAKLKALLRKAAARTRAELWSTIGRLLDACAPVECANYLNHCGYAFHLTRNALGSTSRFCGGQLFRRQLGERAGGAICRIDELHEVEISRLEDVHHGAALAAPEAVLGNVLAKRDALEALVPARRLAPTLCRGRTPS